MPSKKFRDYLFPLDSPRLSEGRSVSAREFGQAARQNPVVGPMIAEWDKRSREPFLGITKDGEVEAGLFHLTEEVAPIGAMIAAAACVDGDPYHAIRVGHESVRAQIKP